MKEISPELGKEIERIRGYALACGLDFYEVIFEVLEYDEINQVASYGGFPTRYPHWSFGMEYERMSKSYTYGLSKIYEMVINNDPCYAYLLKGNSLVDQKIVIAHVYAHCDFFKNNAWFAKTNRKMMDEIANHSTRIRKYVDRYGLEEVERFMDCCKSIEDLIDFHAPFVKRHALEEGEGAVEAAPVVRKLKSKSYMDSYINPKAYLDQQQARLDQKRKARKKFPPEPHRDVLEFLLQYAPLDPWQRDILSIIREESYYFAPQGQTKIMNEGWASYWHSTIMTQKALTDSEVVDYADHHSGTLGTRPGVINPYKIGIELFRDIEERWNRGKFGKEYCECEDLNRKAAWNKNLGQGRAKIFEVRRTHNDITFIDGFLTDEFAQAQKLFVYEFNPKNNQYEIVSRDTALVKRKLLFSLTNFGRPFIYVVDGNYENRGELLLSHAHEGIDLQLDWARETLARVFLIWQRPVNLETLVEGKPRLLTFDGKEHHEKSQEKDVAG